MAIRGTSRELLQVAMTGRRLSRRAAMRQAMLFGSGAAGLAGLRPHLATGAAQEEPTRVTLSPRYPTPSSDE